MWPKREDIIISGRSDEFKEGFNEGFSTCHDAFMKVIESQSRVSPHKLYEMAKGDGDKYRELMEIHGYIISKKSQLQLIPLDYSELESIAHEFQDRISFLKYICATFGQSKEKLVPIDIDLVDLIMNLGALTQRPGDARDFQRAFLLWDFPNKENVTCPIGLHDTRDQAILKIKKFILVNLGIPPQREEVTVEDQEKFIMELSEEFKKIAEEKMLPVSNTVCRMFATVVNTKSQAIHERIKGGK